jgi:hypothetical protein
MKKKYRFVLTIIFSILLTGLLSTPGADAEPGSCYLQASNTDVFIIVFDMDDDGNRGQQLWQGRINQGESVKITVPHGQFLYDYNDQPDDDQPLSGGQDRDCSGLNTVLVP